MNSLSNRTPFFLFTKLNLIILLVASLIGQAAAQEADKGAWSLAEVAVSAQNEGSFELAAERWERLIADHPDSPLIGKATYNLGLCYQGSSRFDEAVQQFAKSIPMLSGEDAPLQQDALFFQAFSQFRYGESLLTRADDKSHAEANIQITTATRIFDDLLKKFPNFEDADQARFFQGNAFERLNRLDDAIESYKKVLRYPEDHFRSEAIYFLGELYQRQGNFQEAMDYYDQFRAETKSKPHALLDEVNLSTGKTLLLLAAQQIQKGDAQAAAVSYREAEKIFGRLAGTDAEQSPSSVEGVAHEALYQQALALSILDQKQRAAEAYEKVAATRDSPFVVPALLDAGRNWLDAGKPDRAIDAFRRVTELNVSQAVDGAALLTRTYLEQEQYENAIKVADEWIEKSPKATVIPYLMLDRAEAVYKLDHRRAESPTMFLEVADKFSQHSVAPRALYNAAYAYFQLDQPARAVEIVDRFTKSYPTHELLADSREIKADSLLIGDEAASEKAYDELITDFPTHEKSQRWVLRGAAARFFQEKYQLTIDWLTPKVDAFNDPAQLAEACHWIGASQFFLDEIKPAISSLEKSLATGQAWRSTDETLVTLGRAYLKDKQFESAQKTLQRVIDEFGNSSSMDRAHYYLGEVAFESDDFKTAFANFEKIYTIFPKSDLVPAALYNAAWSKRKLDETDQSAQLFSRLMTDFPDHPLAMEAKAGRGAADRSDGNMREAIGDLKPSIETKSDGEEKWAATYELALTQIRAKQWEDAAETLRKLLEADSASPRVGNYHYELAWVLNELNQTTESLKHFAAITVLKPVSQHAAESYFHLATEAYRAEDFKLAESHYLQSVELAHPDNEDDKKIREKALYKLGWTAYKQSEFENAYKYFSQQVEQFPESGFSADGFFMKAESLFQQKKYPEALLAYTDAQPHLDASTTVDEKLVWLAQLHGAQAANLTQQFSQALDRAQALAANSQASAGYQADAWLEVGTANVGLGKDREALEAFEKALNGDDRTNVRARCSIGDLYFKNKQFDKAINEFKEVFYRYSGDQQPQEIQAWVAYACYEAARCNFVQVADASGDRKAALVNEAIRQFETLLEKYPQDRLAQDAKSQLQKLKQIQL